MANPTTNFGWVMPTSSSLVTNLPADFNTFGQAVDTSMSELLGGTTGQVLSKTSNTNMDFTWVTPTDQTPLTTKGDLFTFTTVDARLGVGANNTVLTADSAEATGLKWATPASGGGMTLLSTTTLSGATTTVSSISGDYTNLFVYIFGVTNATADGFMRVAPNGTTNIAYQSSVALGTAGNNNDDYIKPTADEKMLRTNSGNAYSITINNYASTTSLKTYSSESVMYIPTYNVYRAALASGGIATTSAISSLVFSNSGGNLSTGTVLIYGVK